MSSARTIAINIITLIFGRLGYRITTAIALIIIARTVSHEQYGIFTTALAWSSATLALNDLGLSTYALKTAAKKDPQFPIYFGNTLVVQSVLSLLIAISLSTLCALIFSPFLGMLIGIISVGQLGYEFRKTFRSVFRSRQRLQSVAYTEMAAGLLFLVGVLSVAWLQDESSTALLFFACVQAVAQLINVGILALHAIRLERPHTSFSVLPHMLRAARHFFIYNLFLLLYFQIDQILISLLISPEAVAQYSAPAQLVTVLLFIPLMVFQATTPLMFEWFEHAKEKYTALLIIQWRALSAFAMPLSIIIFFYAEDILRIVYGNRFFTHEAFDHAQQVLVLFSAFLFLRFCSIVLMNALMTSDHAHTRMRMQIGIVILNIILDIVLIPLYGVPGAAIATLCTELITCISLCITHISTGLVRSSQLFTPLVQVCVGGSVMATTFIILPLLWRTAPDIVRILLSGTLYLATLGITRFFTSSDITLLRQLRKHTL